jgi:hypothetical protein
MLESSDLRGLWAAVQSSHVIRDGSQIFRMEERLRALKMGDLSFDDHMGAFRVQYKAVLDVGSNMTEALASHTLLLSFKGSPLQDAARRCLEGSNSPGYPVTLAGVRKQLEPAWTLYKLDLPEEDAGAPVRIHRISARSLPMMTSRVLSAVNLGIGFSGASALRSSGLREWFLKVIRKFTLMLFSQARVALPVRHWIVQTCMSSRIGPCSKVFGIATKRLQDLMVNRCQY